MLVEAELRSGTGGEAAKQQRRQEVAALVSQADYIVTSKDFALQLHPTAQYERQHPAAATAATPGAIMAKMQAWLESHAPYCKVGVVTLGGEGSLVLERRRDFNTGHHRTDASHSTEPEWHEHTMGAFPLPSATSVVDSTGAGDAFIGGFAAAMVSIHDAGQTNPPSNEAVNNSWLATVCV